jgi:hypothetical protein
MVLCPSIEIKAIEGDALRADRNLGQVQPNRRIEAVFVHPEIGGRVAQTDQARQHRRAA